MIHTAFTMDCEQLNENSSDGGPRDWALSERSIVGFADRLQERGFLATYFIVPQAAQQHAALFLELQSAGCELGLHLHTLDQGRCEHLGGMGPGEQQRSLKEASDRWSNALGQSPRAFRAGNFSANDHTFPILADLGFTHASNSVPKRRYLSRRAMWDGSPPYPYWTHPGNRLLEGDLSLLNVPVACHPSKWRDPEQTVPYELRIEGWESHQHREMIVGSLEWQSAEQARIVACVPFTHNTHDYADPNAEITKRLEGVMDLIEAQVERSGRQLVKTTLGGLHQTAVQRKLRGEK
ncbi:MAG: polysaccharide deacetylase family protein [Armatimonadetes bacterium]|nr:polysaccharide deacetylase family protein [Armatimonadota bacterium]